MFFTSYRTIGQKLADSLNCLYLDADDFHSEVNKEKMRQGIALKEEDRQPWLRKLQKELRSKLEEGGQVVLGCSALKKGYREVLRGGDGRYEEGSFKSKVRFVLLEAEAEVLEERVRRRIAEGKHYMPVSLVKSQLETLEIDDAEGVMKVDATLSPEEIVDCIKAWDSLQEKMSSS